MKQKSTRVGVSSRSLSSLSRDFCRKVTFGLLSKGECYVYFFVSLLPHNVRCPLKITKRSMRNEGTGIVEEPVCSGNQAMFAVLL